MLSTNKIYRYNSSNPTDVENIDGYTNFLNATFSKGKKKALLESGINHIGDNLPDKRVPAILIHSNPYKAGTATTPWRDIIDSDNGYIRYFGDNKAPSLDPNTVRNNHLIRQFDMHNTSDPLVRKYSAPIIFFENVKVENKIKGYKKFIGYGVVSRVERIIEFDQQRGEYFPNYVFDFILLGLEEENETLDWHWIEDRRNADLEINSVNRHAPKSWKEWLRKGNVSLPSMQRKIYKSLILSPKAQMESDPSTLKILNSIYDYYSDKKHNFEFLSAFITERIIIDNGGNYKFGWITAKSGDGGVDYIGKIPVGSGFASTDIVVLGQAKCIKIGSGISGHDLARTVARLKRGWIGAFVTTGVYSDRAQKEMLEDKYPILLINGLNVAETVIKAMHKIGETNVDKFLLDIDNEYQNKVINRNAEEILYE